MAHALKDPLEETGRFAAVRLALADYREAAGECRASVRYREGRDRLHRDATASRARALVVEDDYAVAAALERNLRSLGYTVDVAPGGQRAIELLRTRSYGLAMVDLVLANGPSGVEVAYEVPRTTRLVLMSGAEPQDLRQLARDVCAHAWLAKPWAPHELDEAIGFAPEMAREGV